ncbi:MAG: hypothetical protein NXI16_15095 [Alphaproteobacteria bacterium]|nr:hypothetical protein [Alphaproteobacteria bacterium]
MTSLYGVQQGLAPLSVPQGRSAGLTENVAPGAITGAKQIIQQNTPRPPDGSPPGAGVAQPPPKVFGNGSLIDFFV